MEAEAFNVRKSRDPIAGPPTTMLSYADTISMKPGAKGRHDMSNKEGRRFEEESEEWFSATSIARLSQTNQTRLIEAILDNTLHQRTMIGLKERTGKNFFKASEIVAEAAKHRDTLLFPRVIQPWEFIRRFVSDSDRLNWGTEPACRASMRDVQARPKTAASVRQCGRPKPGQRWWP